MNRSVLALVGILLLAVLLPLIRPADGSSGSPTRRAIPCWPRTSAATSHLGPGGTVFGYPDLRLAYDFYLGRPAGELATIDRTLHALANPKAGQVLITSRERWQELSSRVTSPGRVLAARTLAGHEIVVVGSP